LFTGGKLGGRRSIRHSALVGETGQIMARVLALSSHVAFGSVGLAAIVPALQQLGHDVIALPTVVLSNHPGYGCYSGKQIPAAEIDEMVDALDANGWLANVDAVLTGYLPTRDHAVSAKKAVERVRQRSPSTYYVCDPVFGDDPKGMYLDAAVAPAIREHLLPLCNLATPNRFELSWLTQMRVGGPKEAAEAMIKLDAGSVVATSIAAGEDQIATLMTAEDEVCGCFVPRRSTAPHGTGDLLTGLLIGHVLNGLTFEAALGRSVAGVEMTIATSSGRGELSLVAAKRHWAHAEALPVVAI